jgi:hypothetical protein
VLKHKAVQFKVTDEQYALMCDLAARNYETVSAYVRRLVAQDITAAWKVEDDYDD